MDDLRNGHEQYKVRKCILNKAVPLLLSLFPSAKTGVYTNNAAFCGLLYFTHFRRALKNHQTIFQAPKQTKAQLN
jgi:hypothetical protein